jgi:hypothetical protein
LKQTCVAPLPALGMPSDKASIGVVFLAARHWRVNGSQRDRLGLRCRCPKGRRIWLPWSHRYKGDQVPWYPLPSRGQSCCWWRCHLLSRLPPSIISLLQRDSRLGATPLRRASQKCSRRYNGSSQRPPASHLRANANGDDLNLRYKHVPKPIFQPPWSGQGVRLEWEPVQDDKT